MAPAHGTGLKRRVHGGVEYPPTAFVNRRLANSHHFSMGGRVLESLLKVMASADDLSALDNRRPDRHFAQGVSFHCFLNGDSHALKVPLVSLHAL